MLMSAEERYFRLPIRMALLAGFLVTVAAPLVGFWYWSYAAILQNKIDEVEERHLLLAHNLGAALDRYYDDITSTFDSFAP